MVSILRQLTLLLIGVFVDAEPALAADCESPIGSSYLYLFLTISVVLKALSWGIGIIANKTETKWDNKLARFLGRAGAILAWVVGLFGVGKVPSSVNFNLPKGDDNETRNKRN